jgi:hypothetical protein
VGDASYSFPRGRPATPVLRRWPPAVVVKPALGALCFKLAAPDSPWMPLVGPGCRRVPVVATGRPPLAADDPRLPPATASWTEHEGLKCLTMLTEKEFCPLVRAGAYLWRAFLDRRAQNTRFSIRNATKTPSLGAFCPEL